jgi:hypothetical protein
MPQFYRLPNPAVSSISVDGVEHVVNQDGLLEVYEFTPALKSELADMGAKEVESLNAEQRQMEAVEEDERQQLFTLLDGAFDRHIDRRRSLPQLRKMWEDYQAKRPTLSAAGQQEKPLWGDTPDV